MSVRRLAASLGVVLALALPAAADTYDPQEAGHPLRVIAYLLHPIGVALDYLVFRPAHYVGSQEPWRTIFGHERRFHQDLYGSAPEHPLPHSHATHSKSR